MNTCVQSFSLLNESLRDCPYAFNLMDPLYFSCAKLQGSFFWRPNCSNSGKNIMGSIYPNHVPVCFERYFYGLLLLPSGQVPHLVFHRTSERHQFNFKKFQRPYEHNTWREEKYS